MIRYVAVIDLGKTNSKIALVDTRTAEEVEVVKQAAIVITDGLYPSLDHVSIEAFIIETLKKLARSHSIDAITVTTHGATVALIDEAGGLALPVLDYEFQDVDSVEDEYLQHRPPFIDTGSPVLPGGLNIGKQLYWQQKEFPDKFAKVKTIMTWPQYWVFVLSGERHNDVTSLGCHTDLYEPRRKRYSELVESMGWMSLMPPVSNSGQLSGPLRTSIRDQIGLPQSIPVYTGIHDSNASLVPHLVNQEAPFSVVSTGTWFVAMAIGGASVELDEWRDTLLNVSAFGECVPSSRFMGGRERELLVSTSSACEQSLDELLTNEVSPPMLLPSIARGTGPYPQANHCWIGDSIDNRCAVRDSAIGLYLALMTQECLQLIGGDGPTYVEGPLAQNNQFLQMLAAASSRPVLIGGAETGTSVGAAMLINQPTKPPAYRRVNVAADRRDILVRYGLLWQRKLRAHVK